MKSENCIGNYGIFATMVVTILGIRVFDYARELTADVGGDGWLVVLAMALLGFVLALIYYKVVKLNDYEDFYTILRNNLGSVLGTLVAVIFVLYLCFYASLGLRGFIEQAKMYLLEKTPTEMLIVIAILVSAYLVRGEVSMLVKFNEVAFWIMFVPFFIVMLFALYQADFTNLLPALQNDPMNYVTAGYNSMTKYQGAEILFLVLPFMMNRNDAKKVMKRGIVFIAVFYLVIIILSVAVFSQEQTKILLWPTITLVKSIDIPGIFVERWDGIVLSLWILFIITTLVNVFYFAADIMKSVMKCKDQRISLIVIVPFLYLFALFPENIGEIEMISSEVVPVLFLVVMVLLPIILLIVSYVKSKGGRKTPARS